MVAANANIFQLTILQMLQLEGGDPFFPPGNAKGASLTSEVDFARDTIKSRAGPFLRLSRTSRNAASGRHDYIPS